MSKSNRTEIRFDSPFYQVERARQSAPGAGHFSKSLKAQWCWRCSADKPRAGSKKRGAGWWCADCVKSHSPSENTKP